MFWRAKLAIRLNVKKLEKGILLLQGFFFVCLFVIFSLRWLLYLADTYNSFSPSG